MDGWGFRDEQQRLADRELAGVPVIVVTALAEGAEHAETLGAIDLIAKPIDFDRMLEVVHRHYPVDDSSA
jgi:FixJ family two-component response regulator